MRGVLFHLLLQITGPLHRQEKPTGRKRYGSKTGGDKGEGWLLSVCFKGGWGIVFLEIFLLVLFCFNTETMFLERRQPLSLQGKSQDLEGRYVGREGK